MEGDNIIACPSCGHVLMAQTSARFCPECGARLPTGTEEADPAGRVRILTLAFVDLVGSTELAAQLNPEAFNARLQAFHRRVTQDLATYGGTQVQHYGDGLLVCFGFEADAENAALAAVKWAMTLPGTAAPDVVRIGIHSGEVFCATDQSNRMSPNVTGFELNLTARIQGQAEPGGVVVSDRTATFCNRLADLEGTSLGDVALKGVPDPVRLTKVNGLELRGLPARPMALIERDALLADLTSSNRSDHKAIIADPGMGKSTVLEALPLRLEERRKPVLWLARLNLKNTSLFPIGQWLAGELGYDRFPLSDAADPSDVAEKLQKFGLEGPAIQLVSDMVYGAPFGKDLMPQEARAQRLRGIVELLRAMSASQPISLLIDDGQWLDTVSHQLLEMILAELPSEACQITLTLRRDDAMEAFCRDKGIELIELPPLSAEGTQSLLATIGRDDIDAETLAKAADRAEGNPLFAVTLAEQLKASEDADLPDTIEATYQGIIAGLPGKPRKQLLDAAILGRSFPREHLKLASLAEDHVIDLEPLTSKGLLAEDGQTLSFSHIFLQEAAYAMLPLSQRQERHGKVAREMEARNADGQPEFPEVIADHAKASADDGLIARTCMVAGISYLQSARFNLAVDYLTSSTGAFEALDALGIEALTLLASAQVQLMGFTHPDVEASYLKLTDRVQGAEAGNNGALMARYGLFAHRMMSGRVRQCGPLVADMRASADPENPVHQLLVHVNECAFGIYSGRFDLFDASAEKLFALYDPAQHGQIYLEIGADPMVSVVSAAAHRHAYLGDADTAQMYFDKGDQLITELGANLQRPWMNVFGGAALWYAGLKEDAREKIAEGIALADTQGAAFWSLVGRVWQSALNVEDGLEGPEMLEALLAQMQAFGIQSQRPYFDAIVGSHMVENGQAEAGRARIRADLRQALANGANQFAHDIALRLSVAESACGNEVAALNAARLARAYAVKCDVAPWVARADARLTALGRA